VVVVLSVVVDVPGVEVASGVGTVVVVVEVLSEELEVAGVGFTTVVFCSVFSGTGEVAAGAVV
jgi:hypothetical protein